MSTPAPNPASNPSVVTPPSTTLSSTSRPTQKNQNQQPKKKQQHQQKPSTRPIGSSSTSGAESPQSSTATSASSSKSGNNRGPRGDSPIVRLSKALSWLLRHNAVSQGIKIRPDGFVLLEDVLGHPKFKGFTLENVLVVVENNDKKRFEMMELDGQNYIRAKQGHSIVAVAELGYEELTDPVQVPVALHGTQMSKWNLIGEQGLSKMNRNHIHMAVGLPGEDGVISGMRTSCNLYIYVDTAKALKDGIRFFKSSNNVILSDGKNGDGIIPPAYFAKVLRSSGEVIFPKSLSA